MKYLRLFKTNADYESVELIKPNVSYIEENKVVFYIPKSEEPIAPVGASIYGLDGKFYTPEEWTLSGKSSDQVVGVAVSDGDHSFVIHPTEQYDDAIWSSSTNILVDGVFTTEDTATAESDFAGEANTAAILTAVSAGTITDAPAAQYANSIVFAHGKIGYLLSAGELKLAYQYLADINNCMTSINGIKFNLDSYHHLSSTQYSIDWIWVWSAKHEWLGVYGKDSTNRVRVVAAL